MAVGAGELIMKTISVTPGKQYSISIGNGGKGGEGIETSNSSYVYGTDGEQTSAFGITAKGGIYTSSNSSNYSSSGSLMGDNNRQGSGTNGKNGYCIVSYKTKKEEKNIYLIPLNKQKQCNVVNNKYNTSKTKKFYNSAGTYSLKIPDNVSKITVSGCGGGAGGITVGAYNSCPELTMQAGNGGDTKIGTFVIAGGKGAKATLTTGNIMSVVQPEVKNSAIKGSYFSGRNIDRTINGYGFMLNTNCISNIAEIMDKIGYYYAKTLGVKDDVQYIENGDPSSFNIYGAGGGTYHFYDSDGTSNQIGVAGNSGEFISQQSIDVTPGSTIQITIGAGGKSTFYSNDNDRNKRFRVSDGTDGFLIIEYGDNKSYLASINKNINVNLYCTLDNGLMTYSDIYINGDKYTSNKFGIIVINKKWGITEDLNCSYTDSKGLVYSFMQTVQYGKDAMVYIKFISIVDGEKTWTSTEVNNKTISFTVPNGITKIKIAGQVDYLEGVPGEENNAYIKNTANSIVWGNGYSITDDNGENYEHADIESVVEVTPNKTYNLLFYCGCTNGVTFSYGKDINNTKATISDL